MWQSFISSVLHASLWYAVLMLQFIEILFNNSGSPRGCNYFKAAKLQLPIVVSGCCSLANSSHSRLHLLQGFSKHRLHAILVTFVFTRPKILCNLYQLMLEMKSPFLFTICFPHTLCPSFGRDCCPFSHCGKPLLRILILCFTLCHRCYSPAWQSRSSSIADPPLGLAAELLLSWDTIWPQLSVWWLYELIHVGERGWQPCWDQNSKDCIFWIIQRSMWRA